MIRPFARLYLLWRARLALSLQLAPELALEILQDERLAANEEAERLKRRAWRMLQRRGGTEVPQQAERPAPRADSDPSAGRVEQELGIKLDAAPLRRAMSNCLAEMRAGPVGDAASPQRATAGAAGDSWSGHSSGSWRAAPASEVLGFRLVVDDGGEFVVMVGDSFTLGHARGGRADLPFLADLEAAHARVFWVESFHGGGQWWAEPLAGGLGWRGERVEDGPVPLRDGDRLELATNLTLAFRAPDPASSTVRLDLLSGIDCYGAAHVLLMRPGESGRLRIGPSPRRHVCVADLEQEVELELAGEGFVLSCQGGVTRPGGQPQASIQLRLPPPARIELDICARAAGGPPFAVGLRPLPDEGGAA